MRSTAIFARVFVFACVMNLAALAAVLPGLWRPSDGGTHVGTRSALQYITPFVCASLLIAGGVAMWLRKHLDPLYRNMDALSHGYAADALAPSGSFALLHQRYNTFVAAIEHARVMQRERLSELAHELRTPLTLLHGEIEAMREGLRPADAETLHVLDGETRRLIQLVGELEFIKNAIPASRAAARQPFDLAALIATVIASYRLAIDERHLQVRFFHDADCIVACAPHRLIQLFGNLMKNSVLHTAEHGQAQICVCKRHDALRVVWEDSSPGVRDADLPQLTRRGFRADRHAPGSGLGLAIVAEVAREHGVRLDASHSVLGGLRWTLDFPRGCQA